MVNWHDPLIVQQDLMSDVVLAQIVDAVFVWEFVTTLHFDWKLLSAGREEWRWPTLLYFLSRLTAFIFAIFQFVTFNLKSEFDCNALIHTLVVFAYFPMGFSSVLIGLRIIAIFNRKMLVVIFVTAAVLTNIALLLYGIIEHGESFWDPETMSCVFVGTDKNRLNIVVTFVSISEKSPRPK